MLEFFSQEILFRFRNPTDLHWQGDRGRQEHLHPAGAHRQDQGALLYQVRQHWGKEMMQKDSPWRQLSPEITGATSPIIFSFITSVLWFFICLTCFSLKSSKNVIRTRSDDYRTYLAICYTSYLGAWENMHSPPPRGGGGYPPMSFLVKWED
jgi:hypothetical protein